MNESMEIEHAIEPNNNNNNINNNNNKNASSNKNSSKKGKKVHKSMASVQHEGK